MIIGIIILLLLISFGMSLASLKDELKKHKQLQVVEKELSKGKILFQAPSSLEDED